MHSYLRTIKILQATALLSSWKGVAISAALMTVTVLMQILINFSKSERSTAAQGCIWKDKECESGY
uniref:Putative ovule protein n=1 Tax=Solanum chacoense TaxID=4108 RepID=A0A0V0HHV8_SOLCH